MKYSDLGHAFNRNKNKMSLHECKLSGSLVVRWQLTDQAYLDRNMEKPFFYKIVKLHLFFVFLFFYLRLFFYLPSARGELYILHLYLVAFIFIIS